MAVLFDGAGGDVVTAKKMAGYSDSTATSDVLRGLKDEISEAPKAVVAMGNALVDPTELGIRDKMTAARDLLDRAGFMKTEKINVESSGGVFVLPAKEGKNE